ncbi:MAG: pilus assembly protein [Candidatus Dormiibacterota bacterium]
MVEYALILMLVAMVVIVILGVLGGHVTDMYSNVSNGVTRASS